MLSVIIPVYNEEKHIAVCLDSILCQDFPKDELEIFLVDGMSSDSTREIIQTYIDKYDFIHVLDNPKRFTPNALNIGIRHAHGELIMRLDAHSFFNKSYMKQIVEWHSKIPGAWNVGGVCQTGVSCKTRAAMSIAKVMGDKFGVGNSKFRTGSEKEWLEVDTVPFGCFKREVFEKIGLFNERLLRVQDLEFNKRIKHAGGKIIMVPQIQCTYFARDNYKDLFVNRYMTGYWVVQMSIITRTLRNLWIRHLIPMLFIFSIILPLLGMLVCPKVGFLSVFVLILYFPVVLLRSIKLNDHTTSIFHLLLAFICVHFSYGMGSLVALANVFR